jgi:hypothetical protein
MIPLADLHQHEIFKCPHRKVLCPAYLCPLTGTPEQVLEHTLQCPCHYLWCATCSRYWSRVSTGHDCQKSIERVKLLGSYAYELSPFTPPGDQDGDVYLPSRPVIKTSDLDALEDLGIRIHNMRTQLLQRQNAVVETPEFLIDESTQLPDQPCLTNSH